MIKASPKLCAVESCGKEVLAEPYYDDWCYYLDHHGISYYHWECFERELME